MSVVFLVARLPLDVRDFGAVAGAHVEAGHSAHSSLADDLPGL
jgi:hypothetical protein